MMKGYTYYKKAKNFKYMIRNIIVNAEMLWAIGKYETAGECYLKIAYDYP